jgi:hypothetical protein
MLSVMASALADVAVGPDVGVGHDVAERERFGSLERERPLRRPILSALADEVPLLSMDPVRGLTCEDLAEQMDASPADVERELRILQEESCILRWDWGLEEGRKPGAMLLTEWGARERGRHLAYGAQEELLPWDGSRTLALHHAALGMTRWMRGDDECWERAPERLWIVLSQAEDLDEREMADAVRAEMVSCAFASPRALAALHGEVVR